MELQHIPKTFWHSLSIAVLVVSSGLTYIAYRSSSVSIELANAKINLSSEVASSTIALSAALEEAKKAKIDAEEKYDALLNKNEALQNQINSLQEKATTDESANISFKKLSSECPDCVKIEPLPKALPFHSFDKNILKAEQSLNKLEALNKQIRPMQ